jgi:flagellar biosynthetic protein FliP
VILAVLADAAATAAQNAPAPAIPTSGPTSAIGLAAMLTLASLIPALVLSCTCFVRFVVVLGFVRTGLGTQGAPPNQVLVGLALFMTIFLSAPVAAEMYERGGKPLIEGTMDTKTALEAAAPPLRTFLLARTSDEDLRLFYDVSHEARPATADDVPLRIAVPAFIVSELRTAFKIGLAVLLPFLVIDLVAASVLTALGMVMVPPQAISLPLKLLVFVAIDGWHLVVESLLRGASCAPTSCSTCGAARSSRSRSWSRRSSRPR